MGPRKRILVLLALLGLIVLAKLGQQTYRWFAFAEERAQIEALRERLEEAGLAVVQTQLRADSIRRRVERLDQRLEGERRGIEAYDRHARDGALPSYLYGVYQAELQAYNRQIDQRNASSQEWESAVADHHAAVERYNALADSIRVLAAASGEVYYAVPTPAEIAVERGIAPASR